MYVAIAVVLYLGFAILVGRFCSLSTRWEEAIAAIPEGPGSLSAERIDKELGRAAMEHEATSLGEVEEEELREDVTVGV